MRTTSTSFNTGAGLKKCMPTTRSGRPVTSAISVTESADVLVARIASGSSTESSSLKTAPLVAMSSMTASITRSHPAKRAEVGG